MGDILLTISSELSELTIMMSSYRSPASARSESMVVQNFIFSSSLSLNDCPTHRAHLGVSSVYAHSHHSYAHQYSVNSGYVRIYTFPDVPGLVGFSAEHQ